MSDIRITQVHKLTHKKARAAAQKVADQMALEYDMASEWNGDVLEFRRTGVSGRLVVSDKQAHLEIKLGFLMKVFAPTIEQKVASKMKRIFTSKA